MKTESMARTFSAPRAATLSLSLAALLGSILLSASPEQARTKPAVEKSAKVADGLYEVVAGTDAVYVASVGRRGENNAKVYTLDPKTLATKSSIDTSAAPAYGLGINDKTHRIYTSNTRNGSVSVIDIKAGKVIAEIKPEGPPAHLFRLLVDEDTDTVYVSVASKEGKVWVIDGKTNKLAHVIDSGVTTIGLALDKAAKKLYAVNQGTNEVAVIDIATHKVTASYPTGGERSTIAAFDPKTSRLFVTNQGTGDISVLDMKAGKLLKTVKTGAGALGVGFNPKVNLVYVANRQAGTVTVVDAATLEVVADLPAGSLPNTIAIDPRTNATYVTNKAKSGGRGAPPVDDPNGDTVTIIR